MAHVTKYLALLMLDPSTDGDEAWNLEVALNQNWAKIDAALGDLEEPARTLGMETLDAAGMLSALAAPGRLHLWRRFLPIPDSGDLVPEGVVMSADKDAYPKDGSLLDGHYYSYEGTLGGRPRIETGSYTGDGSSGAENPTTIPFSRPPVLVVIQADGAEAEVLVAGTAGPAGVTLTWTERALQAVAASPGAQWNTDETAYYYVILYGD